MRLDAKAWFSEIRGDFKVDFDPYYFCLMAGFAAQRSSEVNLAGSSASDLVEDFTSDYKSSQLLLIGLLVAVELKTQGIDADEDGAVRHAFKRLVDPNSRSKLTDDG